MNNNARAGGGYYSTFTANGHYIADVEWVPVETTDGDIIYCLSSVPTIADSELTSYGYDAGMTFKGLDIGSLGQMSVDELNSLGLFSDTIDGLDLNGEAWVVYDNGSSEGGTVTGDFLFKGEMPTNVIYKGQQVEKIMYKGHVIWPIVTEGNTSNKHLIIGGEYSATLSDWRSSSAVVDYPDGGYNIYESNSNHNVEGEETHAEMVITVSGYTTFTMYGYSDSEGSWDAMAIRKDVAPTYQYGNGEFDYKIEGIGNNAVPSDIDSWTQMRFSGLDPEVETKIYVWYVKDSIGNSGLDRGYILIPSFQYEYSGFATVPVYNIENQTQRVNTIKYEPGMTWLEWGASDYVGNFYVDSNGVYYGGSGGYPVFSDTESTWINTTDEIQSQNYYRLTRWP